jgi:hypothetical protein
MTSARLQNRMIDNHRLLRAAIDAPDGFNRFEHRKMIENVARAYPHSIVYRSLEEEGTCAAYALGLTGSAIYQFVAARFHRKIFAGRDFMEWLVQSQLREIERPYSKCLALYFSDREWQHVGVVSSPGRVVSQWGTFPVYDHSVFEIPARYGDVARYFHLPENTEAVRLFLEYAKTWGLSDSDIARVVHVASD